MVFFDPPEEYPELMRHILDMVNSAVVVINGDKRIVFANSRAARLLHGTVGQLKGSEVEQLFLPDDREIMVANILKITRDSHEFEGEAMLRRLDGSSFLALIFTTYLQWDSGEGVVITIHDITRMKELERMLKYTDRVAFFGRMLDDINHQIRNPVQVIGGLAKRIATMSPPKAEHVETIIAESGRLENLLNTLNFFIRLPRPRLKSVLFSQVLDNVVPDLERMALGAGVEWVTEVVPGLREESVFIDPQLLAKALQAVALNACEAYTEKSAGPKPVTFRVLTTDRDLHPFAIQISDQGVGVSKADMPHVFSPFFSRKTRHVGMGLTITQRILEEMDGELLLESSRDSGTSVTFFLIKERRRAIRLRKM